MTKPAAATRLLQPPVMTVPQHEVSPRKGDMEDEGEEGQEVKTIPTPPDGEWGWVVVFASFMIHVFGKYTSSSFGKRFAGVWGIAKWKCVCVFFVCV